MEMKTVYPPISPRLGGMLKAEFIETYGSLGKILSMRPDVLAQEYPGLSTEELMSRARNMSRLPDLLGDFRAS